MQNTKTIQQVEQELALARARIAELEASRGCAPLCAGESPHFSAIDRNEATRELLHLFVAATTRKGYLDEVRDLLCRWTGCTCVGIRLTDPKNQIPYESYCGFDLAFWEQENCLSLDRDQCVCIRVVKGTPEPQDMPYISSGGSFVCNNADRLVGDVGPEYIQRFRGTCIQTGYKSITALPLRYRSQIIGAIHMADRQLEKFPDGLIEFIEAMSPLIGEAVHRFNMEDSLRQSNELFSAVFDQTFQFMALLATDGRVLELNRASAALFGMGQADAGLLFWELPGWGRRRKGRTRLRQAVTDAAQGRCVQYEAEVTSAAAGQLTIDLSVKPVRDASGTITYLVAEGRDITLRKHLERQLLDISSREQRRIGQDLHDVLGQNLTGLALLNRILGQKLAERGIPEAEDAARVGEVIKQAIAQARALSRGLCPIDQKADGLMTALQALAGSVTEFYGISCLFEPGSPVLVTDMAAAMHLYHIAQEAINNAVKHGGADQIRIRLDDEGDGFALSIRDNGCGIGEQIGPVKGIGLSIMQYRAGMIGGALEIKRHPEGGTVVTCTCRDVFGPGITDGEAEREGASV
jgi:PAS domain S-box-containing protein